MPDTVLAGAFAPGGQLSGLCDAEDGKVLALNDLEVEIQDGLVHCSAGCSAVGICAALGVNIRDTAPSPTSLGLRLC
jgi:hypothetical protein